MASFLEQLKEFGQSLVSSKGGNVLGIDISAGSIKVVELSQQNGQAVLETYGELALSPYAGSEIGLSAKLPISKMSEALSDVLREAKVSTKDAGVSIPLSSSLINVIKVPQVSDKKLENIIPIEARKYIPVPMSEVLVDWHVIPEEGYPEGETDGKEGEKKKVEALVVAIHKDAISQYQKVVEKNKLNVGFYEIEIFSTIRSVLGRGIQPVMIIDFGINSTKMYIVQHGVVRGSHIINRGAQSITKNISQSLGIGIAEAEKLKRDVGLLSDDADGEAVKNAALTTIDHVLSKAQQVLISYQKQHNRAVTDTILAGGGALLKGLVDRAETQLDTDVRIADPFKKIKAPSALKDILTEVGPEFAVAIGAALRRLREKNH